MTFMKEPVSELRYRAPATTPSHLDGQPLRQCLCVMPYSTSGDCSALRNAGYEMRVAGCGMRDAGYEIPNVGFGMRDTGCITIVIVNQGQEG